MGVKEPMATSVSNDGGVDIPKAIGRGLEISDVVRLWPLLEFFRLDDILKVQRVDF